MKVNREVLEDQLADFEQRAKELHSQLELLKETTTKLGTDKEQFETDLLELENDVQFYDGEVARVKKELAALPAYPPTYPTGTGYGGILPQTPKQGVGSLIFSSISFVVGALLGSKLKSRKK